MKSNNILSYICLFVFCTLFACQKETVTSKMDEPIPCVGPETITDTTSGFLIFEKGTQEFGFFKGTKINRTFEGSAVLVVYDTTFSIVLHTTWPESQGSSAVAEILGFNKIRINADTYCLDLTSELQPSLDKIRLSYNVVNDDVGILRYVIDTTADNKLEIISFDKEAKKLKARFKASFIGEKEYLPDLPKHVRFVDTYIEIGY